MANHFDAFGPYASPRIDEDAERQERCEEDAHGLIRQAYAAIENRKVDALASVAEGSSPYAIRLRAAIRRDAENQNQLARALWDQTVSELLADGEMSESTDMRWTALIDPARAESLWPTERLQAAE